GGCGSATCAGTVPAFGATASPHGRQPAPTANSGKLPSPAPQVGSTTGQPPAPAPARGPTQSRTHGHGHTAAPHPSHPGKPSLTLGLAVRLPSAAPSPHEFLLVPIISMTLYTLMTPSLDGCLSPGLLSSGVHRTSGRWAARTARDAVHVVQPRTSLPLWAPVV